MSNVFHKLDRGLEQVCLDKILGWLLNGDIDSIVVDIIFDKAL